MPQCDETSFFELINVTKGYNSAINDQITKHQNPLRKKLGTAKIVCAHPSTDISQSNNQTFPSENLVKNHIHLFYQNLEFH